MSLPLGFSGDAHGARMHADDIDVLGVRPSIVSAASIQSQDSFPFSTLPRVFVRVILLYLDCFLIDRNAFPDVFVAHARPHNCASSSLGSPC